MLCSIISGCGSYLPEHIMTNDDISKLVDTNDEWIQERTGIKQRHIVAENQYTSDIAFEAAKKAIENSNISKDQIDLIILATTTADNTFPSTATKVQAKLGITTIPAFDVQAVCSGFVYALSIADSFIKSGQHKNILVIGADSLSKITNWKDRGTCILFGDGAGAIILSAKESDYPTGILSTHLYSDGDLQKILYVDGGASSSDNVGKMIMEGKEVFRHAVEKMSSSIKHAMKVNNLSDDDIDWVIPHQANLRIIKSVGKKLNFPKEKLISTVQLHGNTSAASIPLAMDISINEKRIKRGDNIALTALGGGITWGSSIIKY